MKIYCKFGFTLSEVLITIVIIGVIAVITISAVIQDTKEKEYVEKVKKAYSVLSQSVSMNRTDGIYPADWGVEQNTAVMIEKILPYIQHIKICTNGEICYGSKFSEKNRKQISMNFFGGSKSRPAVVLQDGMIIGAYAKPAAEILNISGVKHKLVGEYIVDVNGEKGPNRFGTDIFLFLLTNLGVFPTGFSSYHMNSGSWSYDFENGCLATEAKGGGCTNWVISHSNLDYLHCPDKIRQGKTSCRE